MHRRVLVFAGLYLLLSAVLTARLFVLSLLPDLVSGRPDYPGWLGHAKFRADLEHFRIEHLDDGRGRVLFRTGETWTGTPGSVVGVIGLPDQWPSATRSVQEQGRSGLQLSFDSWLAGKPGYSAQLLDARHRPVPNRKYHLDAKPGVDIRTTVSPQWQSRVTSIWKRAQIHKGAIVVLDVQSHQLLAIDGNPVDHGLSNEALMSETPGSIFKLVTAAAAMESHVVNREEVFFCDGATHVSGVHMACWRIHGHIGFQEAIAQSCDTTFASISARLNRQALGRMANRLGLDTNGVQQVGGIAVLREYHPVRVYAHDIRERDAGVQANTSIGQEDVLMSPVTAANLACTIADHGVFRPVQVVLDAQRHRSVVTKLRVPSQRVLSFPIASRLADAMHAAVVSQLGTAHSMAAAKVSCAIKTGTAELPDQHVNSWMVGFAPYERPAIAFAVFVGDESSQKAHVKTQWMTRQVLDGVAAMSKSSTSGRADSFHRAHTNLPSPHHGAPVKPIWLRRTTD